MYVCMYVCMYIYIHIYIERERERDRERERARKTNKLIYCNSEFYVFTSSGSLRELLII